MDLIEPDYQRYCRFICNRLANRYWKKKNTTLKLANQRLRYMVNEKSNACSSKTLDANAKATGTTTKTVLIITIMHDVNCK